MKLFLVLAALGLGCTVDRSNTSSAGTEPVAMPDGGFPNCYQEPTGPDTGTGPAPAFPLCPGSPAYRTGDCVVYQGSLHDCTACKFWQSGKDCLDRALPDAGK